MLRLQFMFDQVRLMPPGFDLGWLNVVGDKGEANSRDRAPMMVILSIVELLDGMRRFLSKTSAKEYCFTGVDTSFTIVFRRSGGRIKVYAEDKLIHTASPLELKSDVERSIADFISNNDVDSVSNAAEASDFKAATDAFANFSVA